MPLLRLLLVGFRQRPILAASYAWASLLHALGHALFAWSVGLLLTPPSFHGVGVHPLMDEGSSLRGLYPSIFEDLAGSRLEVTLLVAWFATLLRGIGQTWTQHCEGMLTGLVGSTLRTTWVARVLSPNALHTARHGDHGGHQLGAATTGALFTLTAGVADVEFALQVGCLGAARALFELVPLLVLMIRVSPALSLFALMLLPLLGLVVAVSRSRAKRVVIALHTERDALLAACDEAVRHRMLWRVFSAESYVLRGIALVSVRLQRMRAGLAAMTAALSATNEVLAVGVLLLAAFAASHVVNPIAKNAPILAFFTLFFLTYKPLRALSEARLARASGEAALARVELHDGLPSTDSTYIQPDATSRVSAPVRANSMVDSVEAGTLELKDMVVEFGDSAPISMYIAAGSLVWISGPSGSGKSTLCETLLGLRAPAAGVLQVGGKPMTDVVPGLIGWAPQGAPMLEGTLRDNIALGADVDARSALRALGAEALISRLDLPARTLSGGERAMVALARVWASDRPIWVLDEPLAHCDRARAEDLFTRLAAQRGSRTILLVSHDPELGARCDHVISRARPAGDR